MKYIHEKLLLNNDNKISVIGNSRDPLSLYYNKKIIEMSKEYNYEIVNKRCSNKNVYNFIYLFFFFYLFYNRMII